MSGVHSQVAERKAEAEAAAASVLATAAEEAEAIHERAKESGAPWCKRRGRRDAASSLISSNAVVHCTCNSSRSERAKNLSSKSSTPSPHR